jgi:hypothetical protein
MRPSVRRLLRLAACSLLCLTAAARGEDLPEYRLKAAFLYNFALFTEWPESVGATLNLCIFGKDPFGEEIDPLQGKKVGSRGIAVQRKTSVESLHGCQVVFVAAPSVGSLPQVLDALRGSPVLTIADSPGATEKGAALNMRLVENRVAFDANLPAARAAGVNLSSKLLRLAREVRQ